MKLSRGLLFASILTLGAQVCVGYAPILDGARTDLRICVVDDAGRSIPDCPVDVAFQIAPDRADVKSGRTGTNGMFSVRGKSIGVVNVWLEKEGFYGTHLRPDIRSRPYEEVCKGRAWSSSPIELKAVLKRKVNPVKLSLHAVQFAAPPATNRVVALDLETFQWCPPYGNGRHDDLHLRYEFWQNPTNWHSFSCKLMASFPNGADGFYRRKREAFSRFPYDYRADGNAVYEKSFALDHYYEYGSHPKLVKFPDDEYLVFRTRTVTNELGEVVRANYGRIGEKMSPILGLTLRAWFNPAVNDTNLEDVRVVP